MEDPNAALNAQVPKKRKNVEDKKGKERQSEVEEKRPQRRIKARSDKGTNEEGGATAHGPLPVLPDDETRPLELVSVHVALIAPNKANALLKIVNSRLPLPPSLSHLKRIKRQPPSSEGSTSKAGGLLLLLCEVGGEEEAALGEKEGESEGVLQEMRQVAPDLERRIVQASKYAPVNDTQYEQWGTVWPITNRPIPREGSVVSWSATELATMETYIRLAIAQAQKAKQKGYRGIGAVVVNPVTNTIVAKGYDQSSSHPLHHAAFVCINKVAKKDMEASPLQRGNYLCTGYDLYITREPCIMCAMAVLHSRFKRVFYGVCNAERGGLGSQTKLHCNRSLNHHFLVYKGLLQQECESLLEQSTHSNEVKQANVTSSNDQTIQPLTQNSQTGQPQEHKEGEPVNSLSDVKKDI